VSVVVATAPVRGMGVKRRLGELSCLYSVLSPPFGSRVQLSQHCNGPTKPILTGRPGVADDATGTTISTDHQLDARANSVPFERGRKGFYLLSRAELLGELSRRSAQSIGTRTVTLHSSCADRDRNESRP
jgi:hypothetical protein